MKKSGLTFNNIPKDWQVAPIKAVAQYSVSNVDKHSLDGQESVRLCNYTDVYKNESITLDMDLMKATATLEEISKFHLELDDVVITKDSESWNDIAIPAYIAETSDDLVCGYHLAIIRPKKQELNGRFLFRCLQSRPVALQLELASTGVTRYGLPKGAIGSAIIPLPPVNIQKQIVDYLDRETTQIDNLIAAKEQMLTLLEEKREALISQAVTRGLNPNVAFKRSGLDWLGDIPQHWQFCQIRRLSPVKRGASPRPIDDLKYFDDDGEFSWVRISDVTASRKYLTQTTEKLSVLGSSLSVKLYPETFFVSIAASVGKPIITKIKCCIHDGFVYFP
jgi:type I restriction enzyme S subunit